ncbi:hypothetical protein [Burkholderia cepacia]|uniref:Uncharacterized protein n=1 Tax=Burkholderia cepacia GG4 TaxID=1009846 RepID=A0A9W3K5Z6_BURCE|nr:hypothetical protein [Burkholderia cepacia]AFQ51504.1 hypothetical protein GEM_5118 [Burkholderia cepacia GG4]
MLTEAGRLPGSKNMPPLVRSLLGWLIVASLMLGVAGCDKTIDTLPIASANGYRHGQPVPLNRQQLLVLAQWIDARRSGWRGLMETPPVPSIGITITYTDGRYGSFEIWQDVHSGGGVVYRYIYDRTPGAKPVLPLERRLSEQDILAFRAITAHLGESPHCPLPWCRQASAPRLLRTPRARRTIPA